MRYSLAPEVARMFPTFVRGVVVITGLSNDGHSAEIEALLHAAEERIRQDASLAEITAHPRIASWREAYKAFGAKPSKFPPSIEALVRRVRRGDQLPFINSMVAFCNYVSLSHIVPVGGHALDDCDGDLSIRLANGDEPFTPLGTAEVEHPEPGEVVLCDGSRVLTRRWTWRQAEATKVTENIKDIEINVDGLAPASRDEVAAIVEEVAELVAKHFHPRSTRCYLLDASNPRIEWDV